jgi:hypothetical protein
MRGLESPQCSLLLSHHQTTLSLTLLVISHQLIGKAVQCPKNMPTCPHPISHIPLSSNITRTHLHHPPINHIIHPQPLPKNPKLKNGHPPKQSNFKEGERQEIRFRGAPERFRPVVAGHGRDGEVLEDDAEEEGECVVYSLSISVLGDI